MSDIKIGVAILFWYNHKSIVTRKSTKLKMGNYY
jgi:hypothetical protein